MTRRPHGAGSIYQRRSTGKYIVQLNLGTDPITGKRRRESASADTKKAAQALLKELEAKYLGPDGAPIDPAATEVLADYLRRWMTGQAPNWQPRTIELYEHQANHHIIPAIGQVPLQEVRPKHVQQMMDRIIAAGKVSTANKCRRLLYSAMKQAVRWELIPRNPVDAVDPVKEQASRPKLWDQKQVRTFLRRHATHRHFAAFYTLITTGLRRGELLGLRWEDVSADGLWVRQTVKIVDNRPRIGAPKTRSSQRFVALPADTIAVLEQHRVAQDAAKALVGDVWEHPELVFPSETGTVMDPKNFYRAWKHAVEEAGLPPTRIHDMRHLHVSLLILAGEDAKTVSERAGHTSTSFTLDRYGHVFQEQRHRAAKSLDDLLGPIDADDQ
jgi:integrase